MENGMVMSACTTTSSPSTTYTHIHTDPHTANKQSLVVDYVLAHEIQVIAFFLPEAPTEMFKIFNEVSFSHLLHNF